MSKFNQTVQTKEVNQTLNHEGSAVYALSPLEELFSKVLGSFFGESTHYEERSAIGDYQRLMELAEKVQEKDKEYVLKIAELGRLSNMITYPLEVLSVAYHMDRYKGENFLDGNEQNKLRYYTDVLVRRAKDINELLATHFAVYGRDTGIPKQMRKRLREKFESFDAYKLSKGIDLHSAVSLRDSMKMLRPKPANKEMEAFYNAIYRNRVVIGNDKKQIQTELTRLGQQEPTKEKGNQDLKEALFKSNPQALLKHLVNLYKNGVFEDEEALQFALSMLRNEKAIHRSRLLPFQFYTAYQALERLGNTKTVILLKEAVEDALDASVENVDVIDGTLAVLVDRSGSMQHAVSSKSSVDADEMALLLGAIAFKRGMGDLFVFANTCQRVDVSRRTPIFDIVKKARSCNVGGGTNLYEALETVRGHAKGKGLSYDNLILLSDNDCYGYKKETNTLSFGEEFGIYAWHPQYKNRPERADKHVDLLFQEGIIKKVWINNLLGNTFAIVNTQSHRKNLITGFSEKFVNIINIHNYLGTGKDIRKVVDLLLEKERENQKKVRR